jgi:hypothetical protein
MFSYLEENLDKGKIKFCLIADKNQIYRIQGFPRPLPPRVSIINWSFGLSKQ